MASPSVVQTLTSIDKSSFKTDLERSDALKAARALVARLETPFERLWDTAAGQPALKAGLELALDIKLFDKWAEHGVDSNQSADDLASITGVNSVTLRRFLRHMAANNTVNMVGPDIYQQTQHSKALIDSTLKPWIPFCKKFLEPAYTAYPDFLKSHGYEMPSDAHDGPLQISLGLKNETMFDWFKRNPELGHVFNTCMVSYASARGRWLDWFPTDEIIDDTGAPVLVDIAGGVGHDIDGFREKHPSVASRLWLLDLPEVVEKATCDKQINRAGHNFFKDTPVNGARVYYMHSILHDWPDQDCRKILSALKPAMKPGYSRFFINDFVVNASRPNFVVTTADLTMSAALAALERTADEWKALLDSAGFRLVKIWTSPRGDGAESIIEAEPVA